MTGFRCLTFGRAAPATVEIVGRPGSGKSFLCDRLSDLPGWTASVGDERRMRLLSPLAIFASPLFSFRLLAMLAARGGVGPAHYRSALTAVRRYNSLKRIPRDALHVIDEGPVHALFNVFFGTAATPSSTARLRRLLAMIARTTDVFLLIDVPPETSLANARARDLPTSAFNDRMSEETAQALVSDPTYAEIVGQIHAIASEKLVLVGSAETACDYLAKRSAMPM